MSFEYTVTSPRLLQRVRKLKTLAITFPSRKKGKFTANRHIHRQTATSLQERTDKAKLFPFPRGGALLFQILTNYGHTGAFSFKTKEKEVILKY